MSNGIRIARELENELVVKANKFRSAGWNRTANSHFYAAQVLFAISATSGDVTSALARKWASEESAGADGRDDVLAWEQLLAARMLEVLANRIDGEAGLRVREIVG